MSLRAYILLIGSILFLFFFILKKIYKREISESSGVIWLLFIGLIAMIGFIPGGVDFFGKLSGIKYAPTAFFGVIIAYLMFQNLRLMIQSYKMRRQIVSVVQKVAMIDTKLKELHNGEDCTVDSQ